MRLWVPLASAFALAACGNASGTRFVLEGSLSTLFDLGYDDAAIEQTADDIAVRFIRKRKTVDGGAISEDIPLKVGAKLEGLTLAAKTPLNLAEAVPSGGQRGAATRNVFGDVRNLFPLFARAGLTFDTVPRAGKPVTGNFHITFDNGTDAASGRTVFGTFTARVP